jgi:hypothetical protein
MFTPALAFWTASIFPYFFTFWALSAGIKGIPYMIARALP